MRYFTDEAIKTTKENAIKMYAKLASLKPSNDFTNEDIRNVMFILRNYESELNRIERDRKRRK